MVWVVGYPDSTNYGTILFSADGGDKWVRQGEGSKALLGANINDVWAVDENTVWAVGEDNLILKTTDGGKTWKQIAAPSQSRYVELVSISLIGTDNIWISGSSGIVYNSKDGGNTWTVINSDVLNNKYLQGIHAINSNVVYVAGGHEGNNTRGFIARTTDAGQTWDSVVPSDNFNKHRWIGVTSSDQSHIVVYGGASYYMYSHDGGQIWKNDSVPGTGGGGTGGADINCLKMLDAQTWWGAFDLDAIFRTDNGGNSWVSQGPAPNPGNMWLLGIDYYNKDLCIIVGSGTHLNIGKIIKTSNGGQLWKLEYKINARLQKVSFIKKTIPFSLFKIK